MTPKTNATEPVEKSLSWLPLLSGWSTHPKTRRLRRADGAHEGRWIHLVCTAHQCKAKGRLVMTDGTILTLEDLADSHDRNDEGWEKFIAITQQLEMVKVESDGTIVITSWADWNREAAHEREAAKYKKRSERAEAKIAQMEAQNAELQAQIAEARAYLATPVTEQIPGKSKPSTDTVPDLSRTCPESVPLDVTQMSPNVPHLDLDLDETRHRQRLEERDLREGAERPASTPSPRPPRPVTTQQGLTDKEFLPRISAMYRAVSEATNGKARRIPDADQLALLKRLEAEPWAELDCDYTAIATAIELGVERTLEAIGTGTLTTSKPWLACLKTAEDCIPDALTYLQSVEEAQARGRPIPELPVFAAPIAASG